jgi:hypothetical protein
MAAMVAHKVLARGTVSRESIPREIRSSVSLASLLSPISAWRAERCRAREVNLVISMPTMVFSQGQARHVRHIHTAVVGNMPPMVDMMVNCYSGRSCQRSRLSVKRSTSQK